MILGPAEISIEPIFRESGVPVLKHLDLPTVAAIARVASAFVGVDSGVSHLAAATGASGVVIFGPTDPARWRPLSPDGVGQIVVLSRNPIDSIEADEVAAALAAVDGSAVLSPWQGPRPRAPGGLNTGCRGHPCQNL